MNTREIPKSLESLLLTEPAKVDPSAFMLTMPLFVVLGEVRGRRPLPGKPDVTSPNSWR